MVELGYLESAGLGQWLGDNKPEKITGFCNDTRKLRPGECFVAIRTDHADGHDFLQSAQDKEASCALVAVPQHGLALPQFVCGDPVGTLEKLARVVRKNFLGPVIAITGSMGKTTTKDILGLLLGVDGNKTRLNENNELGICMTLARFNKFERYGIVEIGIDQFGSIEQRLDLVRPTDGIITGVCPIHLGNFGNLENTAQEKNKLARFVLNKNGLCVFSEDLLHFKCFKDIKNSSIVPSKNPSEPVFYKVVIENDRRTLELNIYNKRYLFEVPHLMSNGMMANLVLAATYALLKKEDIDVLQERLARWTPSHIRGEIVKKNNQVIYVDCYNANPSSFRDSLENFDRLFPQEGRLFIIGCLSESEVGEGYQEENFDLGAHLPLREHDTVIIVGDAADSLADGVKSQHKDNHCIKNPDDVKQYLEKHIGVVYIKGHHFYQFEKLV